MNVCHFSVYFSAILDFDIQQMMTKKYASEVPKGKYFEKPFLSMQFTSSLSQFLHKNWSDIKKNLNFKYGKTEYVSEDFPVV